MIIGKDNFVWKILDNDQARECYLGGIFDVYEVDVENEHESMIETLEELHEVLDGEHYVCIEVGFITVKPLNEAP